MLLTQWAEKIPPNKTIILQKELEDIDDSTALALAAIPLKDPVLGIVLSIFLGYFGIDRFYKGDIIFGILKLLFCWLTLGLWWLLDCFLVFKGIKEDNFQKIITTLSLAKQKKSLITTET